MKKLQFAVAFALIASVALAVTPSPVTVTNSIQSIPGAKTFPGGTTTTTAVATTSVTTPIVKATAVDKLTAGAVTVGGTTATEVDIGRIGQPTKILGSLVSSTEFTLWTWAFNAAAATGSCPATGSGCTGHALPAQAFTVTTLGAYASVASGGGAATTVFTISDGTNTCTATIACNSAPPAGTSTAGVVRVTTANGAGAGCVFPASAVLTISVTTAGCSTTQPTLKNVDVVGIWQ